MYQNIGLLILRLGAGGMMLFAHGLPKLMNYNARSETFSDPIGLGPAISLGLAIFAEAFCSVLVAFGLVTRYATVPLIITMAVAAFIVHSDDPFQKKEMALLYMTSFTTLFFLGGGDFSLDKLIKR